MFNPVTSVALSPHPISPDTCLRLNSSRAYSSRRVRDHAKGPLHRSLCHRHPVTLVLFVRFGLFTRRVASCRIGPDPEFDGLTPAPYPIQAYWNLLLDHRSVVVCHLIPCEHNGAGRRERICGSWGTSIDRVHALSSRTLVLNGFPSRIGLYRTLFEP